MIRAGFLGSLLAMPFAFFKGRKNPNLHPDWKPSYGGDEEEIEMIEALTQLGRVLKKRKWAQVGIVEGTDEKILAIYTNDSNPYTRGKDRFYHMKVSQYYNGEMEEPGYYSICRGILERNTGERNDTSRISR